MGNPNLSASGYENVKITRHGRFEVVVKTVYVGTYGTVEEAIKHRDEFKAKNNIVRKSRWTKY